MNRLAHIQFVRHKVAWHRRHYVNEDDVRIVLSRLPEGLWARLRKVHFKDDSRGARTLGYTTRLGRREITLCALPYQKTIRSRTMGAEEFGALRACQWPTLAIRRHVLYDTFLHELGHLQIARQRSSRPDRKFASETLAQEFADEWRRKLWAQPFDHPDPVHNPPNKEELRALRLGWVNANLAYRKGQALEANGKKREAVLYFRRATELYPDHALALEHLATRIYHGDDPEQPKGFSDSAARAAIPLLQRALTLDPGLPGAHLILASALGKLDDKETCRRAFEKALALPPPHRQYRNHVQAEYADVLSDWGCDREAEALFETVLKADPKNMNALLDCAEHWLGRENRTPARINKALPLLERALRIDEKHTGVHSKLARAYWLLGRRDDAIRHAREAMRLAPTVDVWRRWLEIITTKQPPPLPS